MIESFLAFDDEDETMGVFNRGCLEDFKKFFDENYFVKPKYIKSRTLNAANIQLRLEGASNIFIFGAYSHGYDDKLVSKNTAYIDSNNVLYFNKSIFYTVSCSSANLLADQLLEQGCLSYFGYKCLFNYWDGYKEFSECANFGLFKIYEGISTEDVYYQMIKKYNECIDRLMDQGDCVMQAALLRVNRDGLVRKGTSISIKENQC